MQSLVAISVFVFEVSKDEWGRASPYGRRSRQADGLQLLAHVTGPKLNHFGITDPEFPFSSPITMPRLHVVTYECVNSAILPVVFCAYLDCYCVFALPLASFSRNICDQRLSGVEVVPPPSKSLNAELNN